MNTRWHRYMSVPNRSSRYRLHRVASGAAYAPLRDVIRQVVNRVGPGTVACLGAGALNDIPYDTLTVQSPVLHLVDWLPEIMESGIAGSIVSHDESGNYDCIYCSLSGTARTDYCTRHLDSRKRAQQRRVCDRFDAADGEQPGCASFERGTWPHVLYQDVTGGYASEFARRVSSEIVHFRSWKDAFRRAEEIARRAARHREPMAIEDGSVDLVISSMVVSQFEHEPYRFFSTLAAERLGDIDSAAQARLHAPMERLRNRLLKTQLERHCAEIERILSVEGACFMAFELFQAEQEQGRCFLVEEMQAALEILAQKFDFDFDALPASESVVCLTLSDRPSIIQCLLLRPGKGNGQADP